ncbi:uncharacterized protein LOC132278445 [Cornus florida]|uniref:uncharacterized protein LOC132278445 n=1 Tax=Cornus florida TaxID=4283 RepID=UPI0028992CD9|nr:uncharacterized protein LOC132278445 [Cornus florida]
MAPKKLSEYERKRLENIKRNGEMITCLKIHSRVDELSAATKRQRVQNKSYKVSPKKKSKTETPIVIRRSLRTRLVPSDSPNFKKLPHELGPLRMRDAYRGASTDRRLIETILGVSKKSHLSYSGSSVKGIDKGSKKSAKVVSGRIFSLRFFPSADMRMVVVGNRSGAVGLWNVDSGEEDGDGIYVYNPHSGPVGGIAIQPFLLSKYFDKVV